MISEITFNPVTKNRGLIGVASFKLNRNFSFNYIPVYKILKPKDRILVRLLYPEKIFPMTSEIQKTIDSEINSYILAKYPEVIS